MKNPELKNNAKRLAYALYCVSDREDAVKALAHYLNYVPEQLATDMNDLYEYINTLETHEQKEI